MSTYSNVPSVSGLVNGLLSQEVVGTTFTLNSSPKNYWSRLLYTVPADSYVIVNFSMELTNVSAGQEMYLTTSFQNSQVKKGQAILVATSTTPYASIHGLYFGPGASIFLEIDNATSPTSVIINANISGVQFTNGL